MVNILPSPDAMSPRSPLNNVSKLDTQTPPQHPLHSQSLSRTQWRFHWQRRRHWSSRQHFRRAPTGQQQRKECRNSHHSEYWPSVASWQFDVRHQSHRWPHLDWPLFHQLWSHQWSSQHVIGQNVLAATSEYEHHSFVLLLVIWHWCSYNHQKLQL